METLADRVARDGPLNELDAVGWAVRLARSLEQMHGRGEAHGRVSPASVSVAAVDRNARGVMVASAEAPFAAGFHSPERVAGGAASPADDTWAAAATLHAVLTGSSPFGAAGAADLAQRILVASPSPLAVFDVGDDELQAILDLALAGDLDRRIVAAAALRAELERWHPDPGVRKLPPLDDDDEGDRTLMHDAPADSQDGATLARQSVDDEEDERTLVRDGQGMLSAIASMGAGAAVGSAPAQREPSPPDRPAPAPAAALPLLRDDDDDDDEDEDDEDEVHTLLRASPFEGAGAATPLARALPAAGVPAAAATAVVAARPTDSEEEEDSEDDAQTMLRDTSDLLAMSRPIPGAAALGGPPPAPALAPQFPPPAGGHAPGIQAASPGPIGAGAAQAFPQPIAYGGFHAPRHGEPAPLAHVSGRPASVAREGASRSNVVLAILVAILALLVAAGATFLVLRARG